MLVNHAYVLSKPLLILSFVRPITYLSEIIKHQLAFIS